MKTIQEAWARIEQWLGSRAPKILTNLNPPADETAIAAIEAMIGSPMPDGWRASYRIHDGMNNEGNLGSLFFGMRLFPLDRVRQELEGNDPAVKGEPVHAADVGINKNDIFNRKWIPLANDGGDTLLKIDLDRGDGGTSGQVIFTDYAFDTAILIASGLEAFFWQFVEDLESGRYFLNQDALEDGDHFLNCEAEMDVVNWAHSPRWKHLL